MAFQQPLNFFNRQQPKYGNDVIEWKSGSDIDAGGQGMVQMMDFCDALNEALFAVLEDHPDKKIMDGYWIA